MKELIVKGRVDVDLIKELKDIYSMLKSGKDERYLQEWEHARVSVINGKEQLGRLLIFLEKLEDLKHGNK